MTPIVPDKIQPTPAPLYIGTLYLSVDPAIPLIKVQVIFRLIDNSNRADLAWTIKPGGLKPKYVIIPKTITTSSI